MLRFFKSLRNKEFGGRISRYLLYAVGEVTLVVIGILIAVRIDNWNENKKKEAAFYDILSTVSRDLEEDVWQYEYLLKQRFRKDSILKVVIAGQLKESDYRANWLELRSLITSMHGFDVHQIGFQSLQRNLENTPADKKKLVNWISDYYLNEAAGVTFGMGREDGYVWKTLEDWAEKYTWYSAVRLNTNLNDEMLLYLANSQEYRNKAAIYYSTLRNTLETLMDARIEGSYLYKEIRDLDPKKRDSTAFEIARTLEITDTIKVQPCGEYATRIVATEGLVRRWVLIVKNTSAKKFRIFSPTAGPDYVEVNADDFAIFDGLDNQLFEAKDMSGNCLGGFFSQSRHAIVEIK